MCVYSMVIDHYTDKWQQQDWALPPALPLFPQPLMPLITPEQLAQFHRDLEEMKQLLARAREYDRQHNQPDCEMEEKRATVRKLAMQLGVDLREVLEETPAKQQ